MRLNGLRAFRYVYEEGSISAAAKRQNLSQPAVSRLLSSLEEEIDIQLFYRNGRRLSPTPEGTRFYDQTNRAPGVDRRPAAHRPKPFERAATCACGFWPCAG